MDPGQVPSWFLLKLQWVTFCRHLKRQTHKTTHFSPGAIRGKPMSWHTLCLCTFHLHVIKHIWCSWVIKTCLGKQKCGLLYSINNGLQKFQALGMWLACLRHFCFIDLLSTAIKTQSITLALPVLGWGPLNIFPSKLICPLIFIVKELW